MMMQAEPATHWPPIAKAYRPWSVEPNLSDYDTARAGFSWDAARRRLDGLPNGAGLNIAHEAVDGQGRRSRCATTDSWRRRFMTRIASRWTR
jgi:hypothetical protein